MAAVGMPFPRRDHAVRKAGGSVQSVVPAQRTLEHVLLDEVERARPVNAKRLGVLA